jgi:hypothetical protein
VVKANPTKESDVKTYRVDRRRWDDEAGCFVVTSIVAWFASQVDAMDYIIEFATDHLNPFFDFEIAEEWK